MNTINIELFEQYYLRQLSEVDRQRFDVQLQDNKDFAQDWEIFKTLVETVKEIEFKKKINLIREEIDIEKNGFSETHIEQYLKGELSHGLTILLEKKKETDSNFKEEIELRQDIIQSIKESEDKKQFLNRIGKIRTEIKEEKEKIEIPTARIFRLSDYYRPIAASLLFAIVGAFWLYNKTPNNSNIAQQSDTTKDTITIKSIIAHIEEKEKQKQKQPVNKDLLALAKENSKIKDDYILGKQENQSGLTPSEENQQLVSESLEIFNIGLEKFTYGNYKEARLYFLKYIIRSSEWQFLRSKDEREKEKRLESNAKFYLAIIEMDDNHFKLALKYLEPLKKENKDLELIDNEVIYFYTALCYIQTNQLEKSIDLFEKIVKSTQNEDLRGKSTMFLQKIKK